MTEDTSSPKLAADTPFSRDNFDRLMENSSAKAYLDEEILKSIDDAQANGDEEYMKAMYPIILSQYLRELEIKAEMEAKEEESIENFKKEVEEIDRKLKEERKLETENAEREEKARAEDILKAL